MDIVGNRRFVEIPGEKTHELPPLLVHASPQVKRLDRVVNMANRMIETEDLIQDATSFGVSSDTERRKMDLAINLAEQYLGLMLQWQWGNDVVEWIRQCETTFDITSELRNVFRADLWPHAGRSSFITLLNDKAVKTEGIDLEKAVGLRLTFRQPPPISCFSDQFLFYLNSTVAATAYQTWTHMVPDPISSLPPERFRFQVYTM